MSRILVIDDEPAIRNLIVEILETGGYEVEGVDHSGKALALLEHGEFDGVVSDILMPGRSGLDLLDAIHASRPSMPVVLVTGAGTCENLGQALSRGAAGLVTKPFTHVALRSAVADALARAERTALDLRERLLTPTLASALANAIELRDPYLHGHCERLASLAVRLATRLGLPDAAIEAVRLGAILHDIGKIGIPDAILLKEGPLEEAELATIRLHPLLGDDLLAPIDLLGSSRAVVRHHHERWDGTGYPDRLAGPSIPLGARIVAVADSIEVMATRTLYRAPRTYEGIVAELRAGAGTQWDPQIVALALDLLASGEIAIRDRTVTLLELDESPERERALPELLLEETRMRAWLGSDAAVVRAPA